MAVEPQAPVAPVESSTPPSAGTLAEQAVRIIRGLPRPPHQATVAGFLANTRAHPLLSVAQDYATRKAAQVEQADQRVEQQFWSQVRQALLDLATAPQDAVADRRGGRQARAFAEHLAAEALVRQAAVDDNTRLHGPRRGPEGGRGSAARTGG